MQDIRIDPVVYTEKPEEDRQKKEMDCYALLAALGIPFWRADHEEAATIACCNEVERVLGIEICKNLFLCNAQKNRFYLLMMPGHKTFRTKDLSHQIGSARLSFAGAEHMDQFLGLTPGSVSVLGLMNDKEHAVSLLIDREVLQNEFIGCHPCMNTSSLKIRTADLLGIFLPHTGHSPTLVDL